MSEKVLHVFSKWDANGYNILKYREDKLDKTIHQALIWDTRDNIISTDPRMLTFLDIKFLPDREKKILNKVIRIINIFKELKSYDDIIIHSYKFSRNNVKIILFLLLLKNKITWIAGGNDLYDYKLHPLTLKNKIINYLSDYLRNKGKALYYRNCYKNRDEFFTLINKHHVNILLELHDKNMLEIKNKSKKLVLIGESDLKRNKHLMIVDKINSLKLNVDILFFANYGMLNEYGYNSNKNYLVSICEYAKRQLNTNVVALNKKNVKYDNYFKLLNNIDVAIFENVYFNNVNLIYYLLFLGKEVYINRNSNLYNFLISKKIFVYTLEQLEQICQENKNQLLNNMENEWLNNYINNIEQEKILDSFFANKVYRGIV